MKLSVFFMSVWPGRKELVDLYQAHAKKVVNVAIEPRLVYHETGMTSDGCPHKCHPCNSSLTPCNVRLHLCPPLIPTALTADTIARAFGRRLSWMALMPFADNHNHRCCTNCLFICLCLSMHKLCFAYL